MDFASRDNDVFLYDRGKAEITGVEDVAAFTATNITLSCKSGGMSLDGAELKIISFDSESGRLTVTGRIDGVVWFVDAEEKRPRRRLFG